MAQLFGRIESKANDIMCDRSPRASPPTINSATLQRYISIICVLYRPAERRAGIDTVEVNCTTVDTSKLAPTARHNTDHRFSGLNKCRNDLRSRPKTCVRGANQTIWAMQRCIVEPFSPTATNKNHK